MIHTDFKQIYTDLPPLRYGDLTYKVRGAIFEVYNTLGQGHKEQVYQKALEKELKERNIPFKKEENLNVLFKGERVGNYRPDFIVEDKLIIELKAVEFIPKSYEEQLVHYLKTTGFPIGLLVNFGQPKLFIKRFLWTKDQCKSVPNPCKSKHI